MHCRLHVDYLGLNCLTTIQENIYSHGISCHTSTKAGRTAPPPCHSGDARHAPLIKPPQRKYLHNATGVIACHPLSREHWCLDEDGSGCRLKERPSSIGISTTWDQEEWYKRHNRLSHHPGQSRLPGGLWLCDRRRTRCWSEFGQQLGHLVASTRLVMGMQGFFDLFTMTTGERGDFPVSPDAVGTEPEIHREDS